MDFEGLAELLIPLLFLAMVGGLIALRMLKPYGNRILDLIREIQEERHQALSETRDLQTIRDRLDMLTERQDFLEALLRQRLDDVDRDELERIRGTELGSGSATSGSTGLEAGRGMASGQEAAEEESAGAERGDTPSGSAG